MEKKSEKQLGKISVPNLSAEAQSSEDSGKQPPTPLRCFTGAIAASTFSLLAYRLTISIAMSFANKPVTSSNPAVVNISAAVRTLVVGIVALGAGVFGVAALGLAALGVQLLFKKASQKMSQKASQKASQKIQKKDTPVEETQNMQ